MSADNDAATKSPSKVFSLKSRFLGGGKPKTAPKDETPEAEAKAETPGPGSSLLAAMLGSDDDGEASITVRKASPDEVEAALSPEAPATEAVEEHTAEAASATEPEPQPQPEPAPIKPPAPPKTFSFRSKFLSLGGPSKTSLPKPTSPEPPEDDTPAEAAPEINPAEAMSEIKAALAGDVKDEVKEEPERFGFKAAPQDEKPQPEVKDAVFSDGDTVADSQPDIVAEPEVPMPFVRFQGVRKTYDGISLVVKDLNLDIEKGEFLTLLGPSGSGKTTTLMMLAGFETPTDGDILFEGKSLADMPPHKRELGFVFQNYALFPHMSVGENLSFPLEVRRKSKNEIRQRVQRALQMVELEGFDKRKPHQLSGGQQQRIAVARALVFDPQLVLMDEPLGALDKHLREQMQYELKRLHRELGVTVVYVTHDQGEALTLSDRIAVFHDGVIQQLDTPSKIYDAPANAFVASFIGENNALSGRVLSIEDNLCTVELAGGTRVKAVRGNCGVPGTTVVVCVRPENLTLSEEAGPRGGENQLAAMVDDIVFHGDHVRVKLSSTGEHEIDVKAQARSTTIPRKGVTVTLSWEPYACRAFAAS